MKSKIYEIVQKDRLNAIYIYIHIVILFLVHSCYVYFYFISEELRNNNTMQIVLRLTTWTMPVVIYLMASKINILDYLKLKQNVIKGVIWGISIGLVIVILQVTSSYFQNNSVNIKYNIGLGIWLKSIILVGFSEEVLFRGFILEKLREKTNFVKANIIQSVLFTLIHFPGWILLNAFINPGIIGNIVFIFAIGAILGYVFVKTDSLWSVIIIHSFTNFASICVS